jgi:hypothetical protein
VFWLKVLLHHISPGRRFAVSHRAPRLLVSLPTRARRSNGGSSPCWSMAAVPLRAFDSLRALRLSGGRPGRGNRRSQPNSGTAYKNEVDGHVLPALITSLTLSEPPFRRLCTDLDRRSHWEIAKCVHPQCAQTPSEANHMATCLHSISTTITAVISTTGLTLECAVVLQSSKSGLLC